MWFIFGEGNSNILIILTCLSIKWNYFVGSTKQDFKTPWLRQRFTLIEKGKMQLCKTGEIKFANYNHDFVKNCDAVGVEY